MSGILTKRIKIEQLSVDIVFNWLHDEPNRVVGMNTGRSLYRGTRAAPAAVRFGGGTKGRIFEDRAKPGAEQVIVSAALAMPSPAIRMCAALRPGRQSFGPAVPGIDCFGGHPTTFLGGKDDRPCAVRGRMLDDYQTPLVRKELYESVRAGVHLVVSFPFHSAGPDHWNDHR
jgi:hypothetical protein